MVSRLSGCTPGVDNDGNIIIKPVVFLGGTVLSFNASLGVGPTQESTLSVEIINDCKIGPNDDNGGLFYGGLKIGSPAFFSVCEAMGKNEGDPGCFEFGGIVINASIEQSSAGEIYKITMVDPRSLLENFTIVVSDNLSGPIKHRNYFNAYAYYEHNVLPKELKYDHNQDAMLLPNSPGDDDPIIPEGDNTKTDCDVFGYADSNDRGMTYRKVLQALQNDNNGRGPMVYSPNYGEPYNPQVTPLFNQFLNNRNLHEGNVFRLDLSDMPNPPQYYRVSGPSISLLQLISEVCDVLGREFIVTLERGIGANNEPYIIKIKTKKIKPLNNNQNNILSKIIPYQGASTNLTYGKELRIEKSRHILLGDKRHDIYQSAEIEFYFGEDSDGNPIVPRPSADGCGFEIDIEIKDLNVSLNCPLFDLNNTLLERKVTITEADIRAALGSLQLWKIRVGSTTIPGDFNAVLRHNYPNLESNLVSKLFDSLGSGFEATEHALGMRAIVDAASAADASMTATLAHNQAKDLETIHAFIANIGKIYYGRKYLVALDGEMCVKPLGFYDENYFRNPDEINDGRVVINPTYGCEKEGEVLIPDNPFQILKEKEYSHVPTNAGGWWEKCETLLGLEDEGARFLGDFYPGVSLSFFRGDDDPRVQPFARFDSSDIKVKFTSSFGYREPDPSKPNQFVQIVDIISEINEDETIEATCGALDTSLFNPNDYLAIRQSGGICTPPIKKEINEDQPVPGILIDETKELNEEPKIIWIKFQVEEKLYIHEGRPKAVIEFNAPCLKKLCGDQGLWHESLMFVAEALAATSGMLSASSGTNSPEDALGNLKSTPVICGVPVSTGLMQAQSAIDASAINSKGYFPTAEKPTAVAIPVRNNLLTYGPWYSTNFKTGSGGVNFIQNSDLSPWVFSSTKAMNDIAENLLKEAETPLSEIETGTIDYPYWPELNLGFLENGPNLTSINVTFGGNGILTNYNFQTYTPKFGKLGNLASQQLQETAKNKQKLTKLIQQRNIEKYKIERKLKNYAPVRIDIPETRSGLRNTASLQRVMCGETYDFQIIGGNGDSIEFNQRTAVGTDTLEKSMLELRYDYNKKAYMSLDGLYSPLAINPVSLDNHYLPGFIPGYTGSSIGYSGEDIIYHSYNSGILNIDKLSSPVAPHPPFMDSGSGVSNIRINNQYLNPLANPDSIPYTSEDAHLGHSIDIVGRENHIPQSGLINSLYNIDDQSKYSDNYRFLGMRGPIVLHSWGYDTEGKPIPNAIDDEKLAQSGIFAVEIAESGNSATGLTNHFLKDWLQKPASWPVGPIDLRFDRERGVWVSPQPYKIVVAKLDEFLPASGEAEATLILGDEKLYDGDGTVVAENQAKIKIVDRIGVSYEKDTKGYCYYDTHSSNYIMLSSNNTFLKLCKTNSLWDYDTIATLDVYHSGTPPTEESSGETVEAINKIAPVAANTFVIVGQAGNGLWYLVEIGRECEQGSRAARLTEFDLDDSIASLPLETGSGPQVLVHDEGCLRWASLQKITVLTGVILTESGLEFTRDEIWTFPDYNSSIESTVIDTTTCPPSG